MSDACVGVTVPLLAAFMPIRVGEYARSGFAANRSQSMRVFAMDEDRRIGRAVEGCDGWDGSVGARYPEAHAD